MAEGRAGKAAAATPSPGFEEDDAPGTPRPASEDEEEEQEERVEEVEADGGKGEEEQREEDEECEEVEEEDEEEVGRRPGCRTSFPTPSLCGNCCLLWGWGY